jgi:hypothetical protein
MASANRAIARLSPSGLLQVKERVKVSPSGEVKSPAVTRISPSQSQKAVLGGTGVIKQPI